MKLKEITGKIVAAAIEVHRELGPGLLETVYKECLRFELLHRRLAVDSEYPIRIRYRSVDIECGFRADLVVDDSVVIELKSVSRLTSIHRAQVMTYMRAGGFPVGLLLNFNHLRMVDGIRRLELPGSVDRN